MTCLPWIVLGGVACCVWVIISFHLGYVQGLKDQEDDGPGS